MLDISLTKSYLKRARIMFNDSDKIVVNGDLGTLEGTVDQYDGHGSMIHFKIMSRSNGIFVDWRMHGQTARIDKVSH
jgi:hypothetical protein